MKNEKYQTLTDLIEYAREVNYSPIETMDIYKKLSKEIYEEEAKKDNIEDLFKLNSKTESKLIELCKEEINKKASNNK